MNERLQKLAEYAEDSAYIQANRQHHENESGPSQEDIFRQKFAELIVQDCVMRINGAQIRGESYHTLVDDIKQHFGF